MLLKVKQPPVHFYRYLYETVGRDHVWVERTRMSDEALAAIVQDTQRRDSTCSIAKARRRATPNSTSARRREAELAYFGLIPDFIGRGLGSFLLATAIDIAWSKPIERLWVHTNTLDHPRALPLYQKMGFVPYAQEKSRDRAALDAALLRFLRQHRRRQARRAFEDGKPAQRPDCRHRRCTMTTPSMQVAPGSLTTVLLVDRIALLRLRDARPRAAAIERRIRTRALRALQA